MQSTSETLVNTTTADTQTLDYNNQKAVAIDANGNYVVVWQSHNQDGSGWGVYAQRFDVNGNKLGGEFRVNTTTAGDQTNPAVAMDPGGDFVIAWQSTNQDGSGWGIYAQRYNAAGVGAGRRVPGQHHHRRTTRPTRRWRWTPSATSRSPGRATTRTAAAGASTPGGTAPSACRSAASSGSTPPPPATRPTRRSAMDRLGDFVVAWQSHDQDGNGWGVYAQRYSTLGLPRRGRVPGQHHHHEGPDQPVGGDGRPRRLRDRLAEQRPGGNWGIYAQRYDALGLASGGEIQVSPTATVDQQYPAAAMDDAGDLLITWTGQPYQDLHVRHRPAVHRRAAYPWAARSRSTRRQAYNDTNASVAMNDQGNVVSVWAGGNAADKRTGC